MIVHQIYTFSIIFYHKTRAMHEYFYLKVALQDQKGRTKFDHT